MSCLINLQQAFHDFSFSVHLSACFSAFLSTRHDAPTKSPARLEISLNKRPLSSLCPLTTTSTGLHTRNQGESTAFPISCRYHRPTISHLPRSIRYFYSFWLSPSLVTFPAGQEVSASKSGYIPGSRTYSRG